MSVKNHPDYLKENERLDYTKIYMQQVISEVERHQTEYRGGLRSALRDLDNLESSSSYIDILANARFIEMADRDRHKLKIVKDRPYFSRIDFKPEGYEQTEELYIGKTSLYRKEDHYPLVIDWRSPIATLYYEGRIGEAEYESLGDTYRGELKLKRQYTIEEGQLLEIMDIDMTTHDELLQRALSGSSEKRLQDIVTTIQAEQNQVIRAEMDRPLLVQGVAGSGKTTIALHRMSYYIYSFAENFDPESMMILAPNKLFIHYISTALPELGVEKIRQNTYIDFCYQCLGKQLKIVPVDEKLVHMIHQKYNELKQAQLLWSSHFKGTILFKKLIDAYLLQFEKGVVPKEDVMYDIYPIYSAKKLNYLFRREYSYLPYYKRIEKIRAVLKSDFKRKRDAIIAKLKEKYDEKIERGLLIQDDEKRRETVVKWMDAKEVKINYLEALAKKVLPSYMKQFTKRKLVSFYSDFITNFLPKQENWGDLGEHYHERHVLALCERTANMLERKQIEIEDTAALLYLKEKLFGVEEAEGIRNVVIDEAQDFSLFQILALKEIIKTNQFTLLGDLSQGIHSYRGLHSWQDIQQYVFPKSNYKELRQSYRTTVEIMLAANEIIKQSVNQDLILAQPVVRHGVKPVYKKLSKKGELIREIEEVVQSGKQDGLKSFAIIGKTLTECKRIEKLLLKYTKLSVQLLQGDEVFEEVDLVIVPSYIVKGLEFDVVLITCLDEEYTQEELDIKLLYVAMTRPLHQLYLLSLGERFFPLNQVSEDKLVRQD